tara:strand:+ start:222 stop:1103 length:882 start_codon:yes stop_codon:yes gene_type:complete
MPTALELVDEYLSYNDLSPQTEKNYKRSAMKFGGVNMDKLSYKGIIAILEKKFPDNANSRASLLNIAIIATKHRHDLNDRLINYRIKLREEIDTHRKSKLHQDLETLPTYEHLITELDKASGLKYVINYLLINLGFRVGDFKMQYKLRKGEIPDSKDMNFIYLNPKTKQFTLYINKYKTSGTYGKKVLKIKSPRLMEEFRKLNLKDNDYLISKKDGEIPSPSYLTDTLQKLTIDNLGETRIYKIVVKHMIDEKDFDGIKELSSSRGTSIETIMSSYNLYAGGKKMPENAEDSE